MPLSLNIARSSGILCLGILSAIAASAQTKSAYVYVQLSSGVVAYSAASNGALTKISGSPFKTSGLLAGSTGYAFYSVGTDYIHSYKVESNGAIGSQISQIDTQSYGGGKCGPATPGAAAVLDHSGKYLYNFLSTNGTCSVYQTYTIGTNGAMKFNNFTEIDTTEPPPNPEATSPILAILGNETYAYAIESAGHISGTIGFKRETSGALQNVQITETDPPTPAGYWTVGALAADPTDHVAALIYPADSNPGQLASYTANSHGDLTSTNTSEPTPTVNAVDMAMSPSGLLLAVAGHAPTYSPADNNGVQIFHFNGANPITPYKVALTGVPIDEVKWDSSNHLYAMSSSTNKIYVYTVTPTSITAALGSPFTLTSQPLALFVKALQ